MRLNIEIIRLENSNNAIFEYLYTSHLGLYEKYGWKFVEELKTFKENANIERLYKLNL